MFIKFLLKNIIKDTDEQSEKEVHRSMSGKALSTGGPVPLKFGVHPSSWNVDVFINPEALQTLLVWVFMEVSLHVYE